MLRVLRPTSSTPGSVGHDLGDGGVAGDTTGHLGVDDGVGAELTRLARFAAQHLTRHGEGDLGSSAPRDRGVAMGEMVGT